LWGDDKRKSLSLASLAPGLFYFSLVYDSKLSTLGENKKARPAIRQDRLFLLSG
jgi:hypothetical protein